MRETARSRCDRVREYVSGFWQLNEILDNVKRPSKAGLKTLGVCALDYARGQGPFIHSHVLDALTCIMASQRTFIHSHVLDALTCIMASQRTSVICSRIVLEQTMTSEGYSVFIDEGGSRTTVAARRSRSRPRFTRSLSLPPCTSDGPQRFSAVETSTNFVPKLGV